MYLPIWLGIVLIVLSALFVLWFAARFFIRYVLDFRLIAVIPMFVDLIKNEAIAKLHEGYIEKSWMTLGKVKIAVYGAGKYTEWLHSLVKDIETGPEVVALLDDNPQKSVSFWEQVPQNVAEFDFSKVDAVLVSSDTYANEMETKIRKNFRNKKCILNFYKNLPKGPYPKRQIE